MGEALARAGPRAGLIKAAIQFEHGDEVIVMADRVLMSKILDNLLNNVLTYGDRPPTIRVEARRDSDQVATS